MLLAKTEIFTALSWFRKNDTSLVEVV